MKIGGAVNFFVDREKLEILNLYESPIFIENAVDTSLNSLIKNEINLTVKLWRRVKAS